VAGRAQTRKRALHEPPPCPPRDDYFPMATSEARIKDCGRRPISRVLCFPAGIPAGTGSHSSGRAVARAL